MGNGRKRGNPDLNNISTEEMSERGSKAGKKSGEVRRENANLVAVLKKKLVETLEDGQTIEEAVVDAMIQRAVGGDMTAINSIFDRIHGKAKEDISMSTDNEVVIRWAKPEEENR